MAAINLPVSHPTFLVAAEIDKFCAPFFKMYEFNYFQYARLYADGSIGVLLSSTGCDLFRHLIDLNLPSYSSFQDEHQEKHAYWFLWDEELPDQPVKIAKECHNLHHGLTLLRRSKSHYDMVAVAMPNKRLNASSYYLNHLKAIELFIANFEQNNKNLFKEIFQNPIALPEENWDKNLQKLLLKNNRVSVPGNTYVTPQELACLRFLLMGMSHKEIALILQLSQRSVATYIARAKLRTNCNTKSALRDLLSTCPQ